MNKFFGGESSNYISYQYASNCNIIRGICCLVQSHLSLSVFSVVWYVLA